jgi:hypothetical protein
MIESYEKRIISEICFIKGNVFLYQSALFYTINLFLKRASPTFGADSNKCNQKMKTENTL